MAVLWLDDTGVPCPLAVFPDLALTDTVPLMTTVKNTEDWSNYGHFDLNGLCKEVTAFIVANSDGKHEPIAKALSKFLALAHKGDLAIRGDPSATTCCWLDVRMTQAYDEYVVPRWHQDGRMYTCSCPEDKRLPHSKYAVALLGSSTRVLGPDAARRLSERGGVPDSPENRRILAAELADCEEVDVTPGQVIRFSWGQGDSPVHSEPDSSGSDRVFVSVLFGSEEEMRVMCEWREEEFVARNSS